MDYQEMKCSNNDINNTYFSYILKSKLMSKEEEIEIFKKIKDLEFELISDWVDSKFTDQDIIEIKSKISKTIGSKLLINFNIMLNVIKNDNICKEVKLKECLFVIKRISINYEPMFKKEDHIKKYKEIQKLKNKAIESNMRLVVNIAKGYVNKGISLPDLIQDGSIGLIMAVNKFDYEKGFKFGTYATYWILQSITSSLSANGRIIRIPTYIIEEINKINRMIKVFINKNEYMPSFNDLSSNFNISRNKVSNAFDLVKDPYDLEYISGVGEVGEKPQKIKDLIVDEFCMSDIIEKQMLDELELIMKELLTLQEQMVLKLKYNILIL